MDKSKYFDYYEVPLGDTIYKIAKKNNIDVNLLAMLNGLNNEDYIYPGQVLLVPRAGSIIYITEVGDTLDELCGGLGIQADDLIKQNEKIYLQPEQLIVYQKK